MPLTSPTSIARKSEEDEALGFQQLVAQGLELAQETSGRLWTDYNEHDPGVTILEQCCYALTELKYHLDEPVVDLLSDHQDGFNHRRLGLFPAQEILPVSPVTNDDLVAFLIDRLREINSVYRLPDESGCGLLSLRVVPHEALTDDEVLLLKQKIITLLDKNRMLGEDIHQIEVASTVRCDLQLSVELSHAVRPEKVVAAIYHQLRKDLSPDYPLSPFHQLVDVTGVVSDPLDQILDGPLLHHGHFQGAASDTPVTLDMDVIYANLVSIPGVKSGWDCCFICNQEIKTTDLGLVSAGELFAVPGGDEGWNCRFFRISDLKNKNEKPREVLVPKKYAIRLQLPTESAHGNISAYNDSREFVDEESDRVKLSWVEVENRIHRLRQSETSIRELKSNVEDIVPSFSNTRPVHGEYESIQNHFPASFGVGRRGLPGHAGELERQHLHRFKGYLLLFDQLMANFTADVANLARLYSPDLHSGASYCVTAIAEKQVKDVRQLYVAEDIESAQKDLEASMAMHENYLDRKNRLLDYLLGLYGEEFHSDIFMHFSSEFDVELVQHEMLRKKVNFLTHIALLSSRRACVDCNGVTNLARRVSMKLGLPDPLSPQKSHVRLVKKDHDAIRCASFDFDTNNSHCTDNLTKDQIRRLKKAMRSDIGPQIADAIRESRVKLNHQLCLLAAGPDSLLWELGAIPKDIDPGIVLKWYQGELANAVPLQPFEDPQEYIRIVENVALRRRVFDEHSGDLTYEHSDDFIKDKAFYAHHITAVMPGWTRRFSQNTFRRVLVEAIEAECPAHLSITPVWLDEESLWDFDLLFSKWRTERSAVLSFPVSIEQFNKTSEELKCLIRAANR